MLWTSLVHDSGMACKIKRTIKLKPKKNLIIDIITLIIFLKIETKIPNTDCLKMYINK